MKQVLVYGDSLAFGMIPGDASRGRFPFEQRWPGALENALRINGNASRVIENCLAGRKTVWDDPFRPGRNGAQGLPEVIELNSPLALVIIALGTNDFQAPLDIEAWASALGVARLIDIIRQAPIEAAMPEPQILVVAPPVIVEAKGLTALKFQGAAPRSIGLAEALVDVAETKSVHFFDINTVTAASRIDGIHLDADQHAMVGQAIAPIVSRIVGLG